MDTDEEHTRTELERLPALRQFSCVVVLILIHVGTDSYLSDGAIAEYYLGRAVHVCLKIVP